MTNDAPWNALRDARLWSAADPAVTQFLRVLSSADKTNYRFIAVRPNGCRNFAQVSQKFNAALFAMKAFGENADALFDILTDLPEGRWIFEVYGINTQAAPIIAKLRSVLALRREGGIGYGTGEAVFLLYP